MSRKTLLPAAAIVALSLALPLAAQQGPDRGRMMERFDRMDRMMEDAGRARGDDRRYLRDHMRLMQEQMQEMHGMMGGGAMGPEWALAWVRAAAAR
jgi:hypothetical protein